MLLPFTLTFIAFKEVALVVFILISQLFTNSFLLPGNFFRNNKMELQKDNTMEITVYNCRIKK